MNLNWYACCGSFIPWHCDDESQFGDQGDPKVTACTSLGSSVDLRVCRCGRRNPPSSIWLDHGDLLVTGGPALSEYEHSSSELKGSRVHLTYRWITHTPTCKALRAGASWALPSCVQGLPWAGSPKGRGRAFFCQDVENVDFFPEAFVLPPEAECTSYAIMEMSPPILSSPEKAVVPRMATSSLPTAPAAHRLNPTRPQTCPGCGPTAPRT